MVRSGMVAADVASIYDRCRFYPMEVATFVVSKMADEAG